MHKGAAPEDTMGQKKKPSTEPDNPAHGKYGACRDPARPLETMAADVLS